MKQTEQKKMFAPRRRKLDNVALAFPSATGKKDSRVFRICCRLKAPVDGRLLQEALAAAVRTYPTFHSVLKRGNFWYYFETSSEEPIVKRQKKDSVPCAPLYQKRRENLLYKLRYEGVQINLEVYHALTDGTGAIAFLSEVVKNYLELRYPDQLQKADEAEGETQLAASIEEQEEDSFFKYYSPEPQEPLRRKSQRAYQLRGRRVRQQEMRYLACMLSVRELLALTKKRGVTVTEYLTAVLIDAVGKQMTRLERFQARPVTIMIPVDLRKFYPSRSMSNFFGWMEIEYNFTGSDSFEKILAHVRQRFADDLARGQVAARMNRYIALEKLPVLHFVPLELKELILRLGTTLGSRNVTAVFSNMGIVRLPERYIPYVDSFGAAASTDKLQVCALSWGDRFYFSITSKYVYSEIPQRMLERLRRDGLTARYC